MEATIELSVPINYNINPFAKNLSAHRGLKLRKYTYLATFARPCFATNNRQYLKLARIIQFSNFKKYDDLDIPPILKWYNNLIFDEINTCA